MLRQSPSITGPPKGEMAQFKHLQLLTRLPDSKFDQAHASGATTPHSGIYKCQGCGTEIISTAGDPLPPPSHHQHSLNQGGVAWQLIVATV
ncbi:MAG TPA: hypothetical protein VEX43_09100 [Chthoniobacterales bacterium]|nr:hypothetical protein [Chthoniobacterales bacterium]